jgi:ABC-type multidrug transport system ATPase subunit
MNWSLSCYRYTGIRSALIVTRIDPLRLSDVTTYEPARARRVLRGVSMTAEQGAVIGIWGRRRSGRSTLLRVAAGLERPDTGLVLLDGVDLWSASRAERALASQAVAFWSTVFLPDFGTRVDRQVALPARRRGTSATSALDRADDALRRVGLEHIANARVTDLDHAHVVRAGLARALVSRRSVLVLDEPTSGLKPLEADRFMELLVRVAREDRIAVLVTASEADQLERADRTLSISDGVLRGASAADHRPIASIRKIVPRSSSG